MTTEPVLIPASTPAAPTSDRIAGAIPPMQERPYYALPGCGLAAYVLVLGGFFMLGMTGVGLWALTVVDASSGASPNRLVFGGSAPPYLLQPLRDAGLIGETEIPDVFHPETLDGSTACAVSRGVLLRIGPEGASRLDLDEVTEVSGTELTVVVEGPTTITCNFGPGEGGDRFLRMLKAR